MNEMVKSSIKLQEMMNQHAEAVKEELYKILGQRVRLVEKEEYVEGILRKRFDGTWYLERGFNQKNIPVSLTRVVNIYEGAFGSMYIQMTLEIK